MAAGAVVEVVPPEVTCNGFASVALGLCKPIVPSRIIDIVYSKFIHVQPKM